MNNRKPEYGAKLLGNIFRDLPKTPSNEEFSVKYNLLLDVFQPLFPKKSFFV